MNSESKPSLFNPNTGNLVDTLNDQSNPKHRNRMDLKTESLTTNPRLPSQRRHNSTSLPRDLQKHIDPHNSPTQRPPFSNSQRVNKNPHNRL